MVYLKTTIDLNAGAAVSSMTNNSLSPPVAFNNKAKEVSSNEQKLIKSVKSVQKLKEKSEDVSQQLLDENDSIKELTKVIDKQIRETKSGNDKTEELINKLKPMMDNKSLKTLSETEGSLLKSKIQLADLELRKQTLQDLIQANKKIIRDLISNVQTNNYEKQRQ